jgi:hypothetical protein
MREPIGRHQRPSVLMRREPIGRHQRPSVLMRREPIGRHQRPSVLMRREPIGRHQRPSVLMRVPSGLISAHECSSAYVVQSRDACLEKVEQSARRGEEHMHLCGEGGRWRRGEHLHARGAGRGAHAPAISGHGRSWAVIRGHQRSSEVIRGHQWQSSPLRPAARFASPEGPPRTRRRTRCPRVDLRQ